MRIPDCALTATDDCRTRQLELLARCESILIPTPFEKQVDAEIGFYNDFLTESRFLEKVNGDASRGAWPEYRITPAGFARLEALNRTSGATDQAFVAMWFNSSMKDARDKGIKPGIEDAGYKPVLIDEKEHNDKIDDMIIAEIRRSRFLVCDFTCGLVSDSEAKPDDPAVAVARGGVYYEAGFAYGLGKPVIWTCRKDLIDHVHFDTRQYNHICWETPEDLRKKLANRISATIGDGPRKEPA